MPSIDTDTVLLIGSAPYRAALNEAALALGARIAAAVDWAHVPADTAGARIIVAAVDDVADAALPDALARIALLLDAGEIGAVITLRDAQIDAVTTVLLGADIELLCSPDSVALVGAIALAMARRRGGDSNSVRESDGDRLRRLNEEIVRIAGLLARLAHDKDKPGGVSDRLSDYRGPPAKAVVSATDIRRAIRARRLRDAHFAEGLFEDPAWDMLLDLYAADLEGTRVSVSSLCIAAAVAPTTALRWIARLSDTGLLERHPDPLDRRRAYIALSSAARDNMTRYFATLAQNGLVIA